MCNAKSDSAFSRDVLNLQVSSQMLDIYFRHMCSKKKEHMMTSLSLSDIVLICHNIAVSNQCYILSSQLGDDVDLFGKCYKDLNKLLEPHFPKPDKPGTTTVSLTETSADPAKPSNNKASGMVGAIRTDRYGLRLTEDPKTWYYSHKDVQICSTIKKGDSVTVFYSGSNGKRYIESIQPN